MPQLTPTTIVWPPWPCSARVCLVTANTTATAPGIVNAAPVIPAGNASRAPDVGRDVGDLPEETIERLGVGPMRLEEAMGEVREYFDLRPEDLNLDLGPLGPLLPREPG